MVSMGPDSPFLLAQRYAFMHHCLCCNVLCKSCVLEPEAEELRIEREVVPTRKEP